MGNYRFKISDLIPIACLFKLKNAGRRKTHHKATSPTKKSLRTPSDQTKHISQHRKSYRFTRGLVPTERLMCKYCNPPATHKASSACLAVDSPRKSSHKKPTRYRYVSSSVSTGRSHSCAAKHYTVNECTANLLDSSAQPESLDSLQPEFRSRHYSSPSKDGHYEELHQFDVISEMKLPPVLTKPRRFNNRTRDFKSKRTQKPIQFRSSAVKDDSFTFPVQIKSPPARRTSVTCSSPGLRLRPISLRTASRRSIPANGRRSFSRASDPKPRSRMTDLCNDFAVVKSSIDPRRDFRDSMVEMIVHNNIKASKDLEELLACYLCLNSEQYHQLIISEFKQIWFDLMTSFPRK